jgi:broad specificity phosphatase PhoE
LEWTGGNHAARNQQITIMKKTSILTVCLCAMALLTETAVGQTTKTIYFVRHAEDQTAVFQQGQNGNALLADCKPFMDGGMLTECCTEVLSPLGTNRAGLLAKWFTDKGLLPSITHVLATHKIRTLETVQPIAHAAGLDRDVNGDGRPDGADVDKNPGDGVQQIPAFVAECEDGYEVAHNFYPLTVDYLHALPPGSGVVVAGHSASLYPIMHSFGIVTTNKVRFPQNSGGRVNTYNNLWVVEVDAGNAATQVTHLRMDFALTESVTP